MQGVEEEQSREVGILGRAQVLRMCAHRCAHVQLTTGSTHFRFFLIPLPAAGAEQAFSSHRVGESQLLTCFSLGLLRPEDDTWVFCRLQGLHCAMSAHRDSQNWQKPHHFSRQPGLCSRPLRKAFIHRFAMNKILFTWSKPDNKPNLSD